MGHTNHSLNSDPEAWLPFELTTIDGLNGATQAVDSLGFENREQAAYPCRLDANGSQPTDHDPVAAPLPAPQATFPLTATQVGTIEDSGTTR